MDINRVTVVCFSPTGGTKKYLMTIAEDLCAEFEVIDLTKPEVRSGAYEFDENDLVIFGAPVYSGRLPVLEGGIFEGIKGNNTPAVFNVSYGNRAFEDALLEEKNICEKNGFKGVAAAAWIAPHTFSDKVASDRPDENDIFKAHEFVKKIKQILAKEDSEIGEVTVSGNLPYRDIKPMPFFPKSNKKCTKCGVCVTVCPTGAISDERTNITDNKKCIDCFACVKACPYGAREISNILFKGVIATLENNLTKVRKKPETFYATLKQ